jgi:hypothetical protein
MEVVNVQALGLCARRRAFASLRRSGVHLQDLGRAYQKAHKSMLAGESGDEPSHEQQCGDRQARIAQPQPNTPISLARFISGSATPQNDRHHRAQDRKEGQAEHSKSQGRDCPMTTHVLPLPGAGRSDKPSVDGRVRARLDHPERPRPARNPQLLDSARPHAKALSIGSSVLSTCPLEHSIHQSHPRPRSSRRYTLGMSVLSGD